MTRADRLIKASRALSKRVSALSFGAAAVYNPLEYARDGWERYLKRAVNGGVRVLFLGMNPGPWGMAQTGVPFGEIPAVRDWMGFEAAIGTPARPHPKRPIEGFHCSRSEVSGRRLWGLMQDRFASADAFFAEHFVSNYCPLVFMAETGRNITPDKLAVSERNPLFMACDEFLRTTIETLSPEFAVGVGRFAEDRFKAVIPANSVTVGRILHPSPANPAANSGWADTATRQLVQLGVWENSTVNSTGR